MVKALYPGTFDPLTNGHLDIAVRASKLFDHLTVAVYDTSPKAVLFDTPERLDLFSQATRELGNIEVVPFTGLMVECARSLGAQVVVRGLRAGRDFDDEFEMALMNKRLAPDVEAVFLMTSLEWQFLSSTRVRELARLGADVDGLVPPHVAAALRAKLADSAHVAAR
jgi:pantetheine-phosphate adenylyltransferase